MITNVATGTDGWGSVARGLRLKVFDATYPMYINPRNLLDVLADFRAIRQACPSEPRRWRENLDDLIGRLEPLVREVNWDAVLE